MRQNEIILGDCRATMIQRFEINTAGRDLIVGDIHGCFTRLRSHLDRLAFDPTRDRLFSVGDLVDRGPESDAALEWLAFPWFHAVQGNHEDMAIRWGRPGCRMDGDLYMRNGGGWNVGNPPELRAEFSAAFDALPLAIELETEFGLLGIVHAECPFADWADLRVACTAEMAPKYMKMLRESILWSRDRIEEQRHDEVAGVRAVVVGHTPVERMTSLGNTIYIDTGAVFRGRDFTIIDAHTLKAVCRPAALDWTEA